MCETLSSSRVDNFLADTLASSITTHIDPSFTVAIYSIVDMFKQPLLNTFINTLSEALIKSPSWLVRNQAALTLLFLVFAVDAMPIYPIEVEHPHNPQDSTTATQMPLSVQKQLQGEPILTMVIIHFAIWVCVMTLEYYTIPFWHCSSSLKACLCTGIMSRTESPSK